MFARVSTYPPLDHDTVVGAAATNVAIHALLETDSPGDWDVQLWHDHADAAQWEARDFEPVEADARVSHSGERVLTRQWYVTRLAPRPSGSKRGTSFTVRFRQRGTCNWRWIRDATGAGDGRLVLQAGLPEDAQLGDYLTGLSSSITAERVPSDTPDTVVWSLEASAGPAEGNASRVTRHVLGRATDYSRWFGLVRLWTPWLAPRQGKGHVLAREDALLYAFQRHDGLYTLVLAVSGLDDITTVVQSGHDGKLSLSARNDRTSLGTSRAIVTLGLSLDTALAAAVYQARKIVSPLLPVNDEQQALVKQIQDKALADKDVKAGWVESWYDRLSYCTWNSLGRGLSEERILHALDSFKHDGVAISTLIIDDNWQSLERGKPDSLSTGWTDFEAHKQGFPNGLKSTVSRIKEQHPNVANVAVWHALMGYWGGISPVGNIAKTYKTRVVHKGPMVKGGTLTVVDAPDVKRLYSDFYTFLSDAGIGGVKTDVQFMLDEVQDAPARRELTKTYLTEWSIAHLRHFGELAISCMSQTPTILFNSQLPTNIPVTVVRNSDDFFPKEEDSHTWHIFCNAHNALFAKYLNVIPDWDMFQTDHPWSGFHAAARCLSGGPIYITDEPGKHNDGLIKEITARTGRGGTVTLRPKVVGRSLHAFVGFGEDRLCLLGAYEGLSIGGSSLVGAFNCRGHTMTEILHLSQFLGTAQGEWLVRSYRHGTFSKVMSVLDPSTAVQSVTVDSHSWDILTARPVVTHDTGRCAVRTADFGLVDKMSGAAAIISSHSDVDAQGQRLRLKVALKALGRWGVWIDAGDHKIEIDKMLVLLEGQTVPRATVSLQPDSALLVVDVQRAWDELGLQAQYSNEVHVEALVTL